MRLDVVLIALVLSILTPNLLLAQTSADQAERIGSSLI